MEVQEAVISLLDLCQSLGVQINQGKATYPCSTMILQFIGVVLGLVADRAYISQGRFLLKLLHLLVQL